MHQGDLKKLINVLDRREGVSAINSLIGAFDESDESIFLTDTAIGIDSSVMLRIVNHPDSVEIVDYLCTPQTGPVIVPGQVIQEFWNNQYVDVQTIGRKLTGSFSKFKKDVEQIKEDIGGKVLDIAELLSQFETEHGQIYDEGTLGKTKNLFIELKKKALVSYVPRSSFIDIVKSRKMTKTPPGFEDKGDGDFFVWVDFLSGLQTVKRKKQKFKKVILLTQDSKIDWTLQTKAHPILVAEVEHIFNVPFEIWDLNKFARKIRQDLES